MLGEVGHDFAVDDDVLCFEGADEFAVSCSERAESGVHLHAPETAEDIFLCATVCECMRSRVCDSVLRLDLFCAAPKTIAFYLLKDIAALFC